MSTVPTLYKLVEAGGAEALVGNYGQDWKRGLLSEHVDLYRNAGGVLRSTGSRLWAVLPTGKTVPVVCSEIISVDTEDGPVSGRCGLVATHELGMCEDHGEMMASYLEMSELERIAWERADDSRDRY